MCFVELFQCNLHNAVYALLRDAVPDRPRLTVLNVIIFYFMSSFLPSVL